MLVIASPSGSGPLDSARLSMCRPVRTASCSRELPASQVTSPVPASKIVQPRVPPFQSPSLAVATWSSPIQPMASGSRGVSGIEPVWSIASSSLVSMPSTDSLPALKIFCTVPVRPSRTAMPLFSCRVTATWPRELMLTYSGSRSSGVSRPALRAASTSKSTLRGVQVFGCPSRSISCTNPVGGWGRSPSSLPGGVNSSLRWFSIGDRGEGAVGADGDRVRLAAQIDAVHAGAVAGADDVDAPGRMGEVTAGGVDDDEDVVFHRGHRRGLVSLRGPVRRGKACL